MTDIYQPDSKEKGDEVLEFIKTLSKEAAIKYCTPKNVNSDTLMDNADFYEKHPEIFELNNAVKKDNEAFYHFLKKEQCLFFALPQDQHELIEKIDHEALTGLIRQQSLLIDAAQNYIKLRKPQVDQNCVISMEELLTKGWGEENESISAIYDETDGFNETFYKRTREEIIDPKIQKRLDKYQRLMYYRPPQDGGKRKSKKQKNNPKRRPPKSRVTKRCVMTKRRVMKKSNTTRRQTRKK